MKRIALIFSVVSVLLFADGLYMVLANYHPGDANTFFGNQTWNLSDGEVTLISAGFFTLATVVMWALVLRRGARAGDTAQVRDARSGHPGDRTASKG
jgi:hypothetical protein